MKTLISGRRRVVQIALLAAANLLVIALVAAAAIVYGWSSFAHRLPALHGWHTARPASEFRARDARPGFTFGDYLTQESRVFRELEALEKDTWAAEKVGPYCRYQASSMCYPATLFDRNWNRTYVMEAPRPAAGVLLVHGLSDSPYSLRTLGEQLHSSGCTVIGLRVPGHGTCPAALAHASCEDWTAAVRIAMTGLRDLVPQGTPLLMVGYSNGGALCVQYAAAALNDPGLPRADGLLLISPMIGITPLAGLTELYPAVTPFSGEPKLEWSGIEPEIEPFKYSSWPINASLQGYRVTQDLELRLASLAASGRMGEFPRVLAVQSAADSTVLVSRLLDGLMERLAPGRGELILFDVNRASKLEGLIDNDFVKALIPKLSRPDRPYALTLVTNRAPDTVELVARTTRGGETVQAAIGASWPSDAFSLSHVALPIPPDDPVYGSDERTMRLPLGVLYSRGEHGVLAISEGLLMRMRYNPCHAWAQKQMVDWLLALAATRPPSAP